MPMSSPKGKKFAKRMILQANPASVLDVGIGCGTYFDLCGSKGVLWEGVEVHKPYIKKFNLDKKYLRIYTENIITFIPKRSYDLMIFGDVLEHICEDDALQVLDRMYAHCKYMLISLPLDGDTGAPAGTGDVDWKNIHELHVAKWKYNQFRSYLDTHPKIKNVQEDRHKELAVFFLDIEDKC